MQQISTAPRPMQFNPRLPHGPQFGHVPQQWHFDPHFGQIMTQQPMHRPPQPRALPKVEFIY